MAPVRHGECGQRLFDCEHGTHEVLSQQADIAVKCPRCSRAQGRAVVVGLRLKLPRWVPVTAPEPVRCRRVTCLARVADVALAHEYVDKDGDVVLMCPKCRGLVWLLLGGVAGVT